MAGNGLGRRTLATIDEHPAPACSGNDAKITERIAVMHSELAVENRDLPVPGPLVSAFTDLVTFDHAVDCAPRVYGKLDARVSAAVGRLGIYEDFDHGVEALVSRAALKMPFCGQTQQLTWWNKDCNTVLHGLGINANRVGESAFDISSGLQYRTMSMPEFDGYGERCDLREPRKFSGTCPDGFCAPTAFALPRGARARRAATLCRGNVFRRGPRAVTASVGRLSSVEKTGREAMNWLPIARKLRLVFGAVSLVLFWQALLIIDGVPTHGQLFDGILLSVPTLGILLLALFLRRQARGNDPPNVIRRVWIDTMGCLLWTIVLLGFICIDRLGKALGGNLHG